MLQKGSDSILSLTVDSRAISSTTSRPKLASSPAWRVGEDLVTYQSGSPRPLPSLYYSKHHERQSWAWASHLFIPHPYVSFTRTVPQPCTRAFQKPERRRGKHYPLLPTRGRPPTQSQTNSARLRLFRSSDIIFFLYFYLLKRFLHSHNLDLYTKMEQQEDIMVHFIYE